MNNFKVETYDNPNYFYNNIKYTEDSLHIVATSALSMYLKSLKEFEEHKNHVWTYANIQKAIYGEFHSSINQVRMKIEIRSILEKLCSNEKVHKNLINDIDAVLNDYKFYIQSGIRKLCDIEDTSEEIKIIRRTFNIFCNSTLLKESYYDHQIYNKEAVSVSLNKYYEDVLFKIANKKAKKKPENLTVVKKIYFYNFTHVDGTRFNFFKKLSSIGIEVVFRIPYDGFSKPWEKTYSFVSKENWSSVSSVSKQGETENKYTAYLKGNFKEENNDDKNISFKEYIDSYEFKLKLQQYPIFQNNLQLINWIKKTKHSYYNDSNLEKNGVEFKFQRDYLTFSKETYSDIFNGTILNYRDKRGSFFNFNEGRFLRGLYNCKWDESKEYIIMDYRSYSDCILSGWIEIKNKSNFTSGKDASDLIIDLKPYMNGIKSIDEIINRLYRITYLHEFSGTFDNLSKEKTYGDKVKEYLHNPLKVLSYIDNNRYEVTIKQLIDLTKKLKRYLEQLIPKENMIDLKEHKKQLIEYWTSISYISKIREDYRKIYNECKNPQDLKLKKYFRDNIQYLSFENKLKAAELESLCTISEVKEYMKVILKLSKGDCEDDSEINDFNYIKLFDQIEGIMVNGTKEVYITDLSEKSINKYAKSRKFTISYGNEDTFKKDISSLIDIYNIKEINAIVEQCSVSNQEILNFIKYYIGALISYSKAELIEFSWIKEINKNDQQSTIYKILSTLYEGKEQKKIYFNNKERLLAKFIEHKEKLSGIKSNLKSLYDINKLLDRETNISFHQDIAPTAWLDLDLCPKKFLYSGILTFYPVYESDFHQRIVFSIIGKLLKSQFEDSKDVEKYFYYLFPQWNRTMKDNFIDTSYKRDIRTEYKFKNIYFPYHIKDIQTLRSKIYDNARRKRRNAYRNMSINSEKYMKEFIKEDVKYDIVKSIKGVHCDMCPYNMLCCKGEFAIERSSY